MALVITNGDYFLAQGTKVRKTKNSEEIKVFDRVRDASDSIKKKPGLLKGYYVYDTVTKKVCWEQRKHHKAYPKRKKYSTSVRKIIYNNANGCCQLCGSKILFDDMTLDHIIPLARNGADAVENLQCSCYACNQFKGHVLPDDFMERITKIFLYQTEKEHGEKVSVKIAMHILRSC